MRLSARLLAICLVGFVVASCGDDDVSFDALDAEALVFVIPEASGWGGGEGCDDGGACAGPIELAEARTFSWVRVVAIRELDEEAGAGPNVRLTFSECDGSGDEQMTARAWRPDIAGFGQRLRDGYELWFGIDGGQVAATLAFDADGRFAGLGHASIWRVTAPLASEVARSGGATARAFLADSFEPVGFCGL